jgi:uncharacterized Zn finger protein
MNCPYCNLEVIETNIKDNYYTCLCGSIFDNGIWKKKEKGVKVEGYDESGKFLKKTIYND